MGLATDLVAGAVLVLGAYLFTGEVLEDDGYLVHPGFVLVCSASFAWGALRLLLSWVTTDARPSDESGRRRGPRRTPRRVGPGARARWALLLVAIVLATFLGGLTIPDEPDAGGGVLVGGGLTLFTGLLGMLIGVGALLLLGAMALIAMGVWTFGTVVATGSANGEAVPRRLAFGPFVACLGLLALPVTLAGPAAYDSPRRRDILPLVGLVRDDVDVTHPTLLLAAQVASWVMLGGLALGFVLTILLRDRSDDAETSPAGESAGTRRR
jgi:hypothetical protein